MAQGRRADLRGARDLLNPESVCAIVNPASGRRGGARRAAQYTELLTQHLPGSTVETTRQPGHEAELAASAVERGFETIVAVGGDGTWSHVADAILSSGRAEHVRFALLPSGTGNDFGRSLGLDHRDPERAVRNLAAATQERRVDVGRVVTPSSPDRADEAPRVGRHFLNLVGFGFDIAVIDAAAGARFLRGELLYKLTALQQLFRFDGFSATVAHDGGTLEGDGLMLTVSNARFFGGGFPIAPGAAVDDGLLHACFIGDARPLTRLRLFGLAEKGRHVESPRVTNAASTRFTVRFAEAPRFEIDGDVFRSAEDAVTVEVVPRALCVLHGG